MLELPVHDAVAVELPVAVPDVDKEIDTVDVADRDDDGVIEAVGVWDAGTQRIGCTTLR